MNIFLITSMSLLACNKDKPATPILKYKKASIRAEVPMNLKGIKTAEISYEANFDVYVSAEQYPPTSSGMKSKRWVYTDSGGFYTMGWSPDGDVRGTYWVTTSENEYNFTAWGIIDLDGDGVFATYKATKSENPNAPITPPDVY
jgi:hypothetical protein